MSNHPPRILPHILKRVLPPAVVAMLAIWLGASIAGDRTIRTEVDERLARDAKHVALMLSRRLETIRAATRTLAANDLMVNGLIDIERRADYLPVFFRSLRIPGPDGARITLTDYRGRTIVSNGAAGSYEGVPWFEEVMAEREQFDVSADGLRIAVPVLYSGLPEGAIVVEYGAENVPALLVVPPLSEATFVHDAGGRILYSSSAELPPNGLNFVGDEAADWIEVKAAVPGYPQLSIVTAERKARVFAPIRRLHGFLLVALGLDVVALASGILFTAWLVTNPLSKVVRDIRRLRTGDSLTDRITPRGPAEVHDLARAFNAANEEIRTAADALRESQQTLNAVIDAVPAKINARDMNGRYVFINAYQASLLGVDRRQAVGKLPSELIDDEYEEFVSLTDKPVIERRQPLLDHEEDCIDASGELRTWLSNKVPVYDAEGRPELLVNVSIDISKRKQAEQALREKEQRFRGIMENVAEGIVTVDEDGLIESFNPAAERLFGYAVDEVIGRNAAMLMPEPQSGLHDVDIRDYLRTGKSTIVGAGPREQRGRRKNGSTFPMEIAVNEVDLGDKRLFVGSLRDITDRAEAAAQLGARAFQQEIIAALGENALETCDIGVLLEEAVVVLVEILGEKFCEVLELQADGKSLLLRTGLGWNDGLVGHNVRPADSNSLGAYTLCSKGPVMIEDVAAESRFSIPPSLLEHGVTSGLTTVIPGQDRPYGIIGVYTLERREFSGNDVHFLRSVAHMLGAAIDRDRVEHGKRKIEAQLRQIQKMESLGTLAGGIAHEFNNMLVPMLGLTELVRDDLAAESLARTNLEKVLEAGARAKSLVQQVLAFSRESEPDRRPLELQPVLREGLELLRATLPTTIEIRACFDEAPATVCANPTEIHQLLMNLASNAADAMEGKIGMIEFSLRPFAVDADFSARHSEASAGAFAKLTVGDTGSGIDPTILARIFDPFFTSKEVGAGTGMGLAIVHGIVTGLGGVIEVSSEQGLGTTFNIYLPLVEEDVTSAAVAGALSATGMSPAAWNGGDVRPVGVGQA